MKNNTRESLLSILKNNSSGFISGESISKTLGISRAAVWKHINELKSSGYKIVSVTNKGYSLVEIESVYNEVEIKNFLETEKIGRNLIFHKVVGSTNEEARKLAVEGCPDGLTVVADVQTHGKGRLDRQWVSEGDKGIWLSVVLKPDMRPQDVGSITLAAAIAVVNAIMKTTGINANIKWPNDIIINGKKVCGILTEMSCDPDRIKYIVVGIGLNVNHDKNDFSGELSEKATSLYLNEGICFSRAKIAGVLLNELESIYNVLCSGEKEYIIKKWKEMSSIFGKRIKYFSYNSEGYGFAKNITQDGNLVVIRDDGSEIIINSGEVSVRGVMGYDE